MIFMQKCLDNKKFYYDSFNYIKETDSTGTTKVYYEFVLAKDEMKTGRLVFNGSVDKAKEFFNVTSMEEIIKIINRVEEGGLGKADELLKKFNDMNEEVKVNE